MSRQRQYWLWVLFYPPFLVIAETSCVWSAPRILGWPALALLNGSVMTTLLILIALPAALFFGVTAITRRNQPGELTARGSQALACLCFLGLSIPAIGVSLAVRSDAFERASLTGDQIVQALANYKNDLEEYPESLESLVPKYLAEIPYTGLIGYPEFEYRKDYHDIDPCPGEYELRIDCPSGGINFDRFIYWPSEVYPPRIQGNGVQRIRGWAYVHE
ncbi:MAG: hypothetical protein JSS49_04405 [Planctomycetes bacterium]|nr:hypothetical protein [Planctomycetota bacterium]